MAAKTSTVNLKTVVDPAEDDKKKSRFYRVKSAVDKHAEFPVRVSRSQEIRDNFLLIGNLF